MIETNHRKQLQIDIKDAAVTMDRAVHHNEILGMTMLLGVECSPLQDLLKGRTDPDNEEILPILIHTSRLAGESIAYVMNTDGTVVSCTPYDQGKTLTGNNYSFRPYFKEAMQGTSVVYPALGVTTNKRGLYYASAIYDSKRSNCDPIGVIVVKTGLSAVEEFLESLDGPAALISPTGVVFASSLPDWNFKSAYPVEETALANLESTRQFSEVGLEKPLNTLPVQLNLPRVEYEQIPYAVERISLSLSDEQGRWQLVYLRDMSTWFPLLHRVLVAGSAFILTVLILYSIVSIHRNRSSALERQRLIGEAAETYRSIFNAADDAVFIHDEQNGKILDVNERAEELLGYPKEEILRRNLSWASELCSSRPAQEAREYIQRAIAEGPQLFEWSVTRKEGSWRWISVRLKHAVINGNDCLIAGAQDITERKKVAAELEESGRKIATLMTNLPGMAYRCRYDEHWTMEFVSEGCVDLTGYEADELIHNRGVSYENLIHPEDRQRVRDVVGKALAAQSYFQVEYRIQTAKGQERWVWEKGQGVFNANYDLVALEGFIGDITEQKKAEMAVSESRQMLRSVLDAIPVRVFWKNREGTYLGCNQHFADDTDIKSPKDVFGKTDYDLVWKEQAHVFQRHDQEVMESGKAKLDYEEAQTSKQGTLRWMQKSKIPLRDAQGNIIGVLGCYEDITEKKRIREQLVKARDEAEESRRATQETNRKLAESIEKANLMAREAIRADQAKSDFLANMSHEIRTPMNAIIGFTEILLSEDMAQEQHQYIQIIRENGDALLRLIDDILDFSKIEAGEMDMQMSDCDMQALCKSIENVMVARAQERNLEFAVHICNEVPGSIRTDHGRLKQCLINLINNAIKFTQQGHVHLNVNLEQANKRLFVRFDVEDTGIGIPADKQETIFDAFTQVDAGMSRQYGGTGLGLAITRQLAQLLGGRISLSSQPGRGSVFTLWIPAEDNSSRKCDLQTTHTKDCGNRSV